MKLYKLTDAIVIHHEELYYRLNDIDWDAFINRKDLFKKIVTELKSLTADPSAKSSLERNLLPPVGHQEVWASGVTYLRSREARMEESKDAGGGDFYARVYAADRPELFFKAPSYRVVGHRNKVRIRKDSKWNVPEPELTLFICTAGTIEGYAIGNDMSSRDIEGENPLYLPQAKSYDGSTAIGPCLYVAESPIKSDSIISIIITRNSEKIFTGEISINRMKRTHTELVDYLFREMTFPYGTFLMTGTGLVPPDNFTLHAGDIISITIENIGTLENTVA